MRPDDEGLLIRTMSDPGYRPQTQKQLLHRLQLAPKERARVRRLLESWIADGRVVRLPRGRLALAVARRVTGRVQRHADGFAFVVPDDDDGPDLFVAARHAAGLMSGDRVEAEVTRTDRVGRREGRIVEVIERGRTKVLGLYLARGRDADVHPFDPALARPLPVAQGARGGARDGQVVEAEIVRAGRDTEASARVIEVIGDLDAPGVDSRAVARKYGLAERFPADAARQADALPSRIGPKAACGRRRFDDPPPVTIDGETARDFDDAIAVSRRAEGGYRLFVHIADVSHFVLPGSPLDREARRRGTSVYFPERVLPMFPEKLSNGICSLRPGVDRLVHTAILDFDSDGRRVACEFVDGVIRSAGRLTYTQVAELLDGGRRVVGVPSPVRAMLERANALRQLLERRRGERGSVDFDLPEPKILLDVEGTITGIRIEPRNRAHRLIEEFMIAANEAVAETLERRGGEALFRIHDRPRPEKLEALAGFVRGLGLDSPVDESTDDPLAFQRLLRAAKGRDEEATIHTVALRTMAQARYSVENDGHFGLASAAYTHFTSPIRRYPDLVVHRLLRARRRGAGPDREAIEEIASHCTERERNAEAAERELLNWKKVALVRDRIGDRFDGVVTGVSSFGMFIQLEENLVEGLLRVDRLGDERFLFDDRRMRLTGERSGTSFRLGQRLEVRLERVDRVLLRVDFGLPGGEPPSGRAGSRSRRRKRS